MRILAVAILVCVSSLLFGDTPSASLTGTVTDSSGGVLSAVAVTAKNLNTSVTRGTTTNQAGVYLLLGLQAGAYEISAARPGFNTTTQAGVVLRVSDEVR